MKKHNHFLICTYRHKNKLYPVKVEQCDEHKEIIAEGNDISVRVITGGNGTLMFVETPTTVKSKLPNCTAVLSDINAIRWAAEVAAGVYIFDSLRQIEIEERGKSNK